MKERLRIYSFCVVVCVLSLGQTGAGVLATSRQIRWDAEVERDLRGAAMHTYDLALTEGQFLKIELEWIGIEVRGILLAPGDRPVEEPIGDQTPYGKGYIAWKIATSGAYRLEVRAAKADAPPGRYRLMIAEPRPATEASDRYIAGQRLSGEAAALSRQQTQAGRREAIDKYQASLPHWRASGERVREAETLMQIGGNWLALGEARKTLAPYQEALSIFRSIASREGEATAMMGLAQGYATIGDRQKSLEFCERALPLSRTLPNRRYEFSALATMGFSYTTLGEPRKALGYYEQMLPLMAVAGTPRAEVALLANISATYLGLGEPHKALEYGLRANARKRDLGLLAEGMTTSLIVGASYYELGEYQRALEQFQEGLLLARKSGNRLQEVEANLGLGRSYNDFGEPRQATLHLERAIELSRALGNRNGEGNALYLLALVQGELNEPGKALELLQRAAELHRQGGNRASEVGDLQIIGSLQIKLGDRAEGLATQQRALQLSQDLRKPALEGKSLMLLGLGHCLLGEWDPAETAFRRALALAPHLPAPVNANTHLGLALTAFRRTHYEEAQRQIEQGVAIIEATRARIENEEWRASYFSRTQDYYEVWIEALMRRHDERQASGAKGRQAWEFAALALQAREKARARSLIEMIAESPARIREGVDPELLRRERELRQRLLAKANRLSALGTSPANRKLAEELDTEITTMTNEVREIDARIRATSPRYAALVQPEPLGLDEIQRRVLDPETLLLEYSLGAERSYLFVVGKTEFHSFILPGREEIEGRAREYADMIASEGRARTFASLAEKRAWLERNRGEARRLGAELSGMLLEPARNLLGEKRLLIVADGVLSYVPFAALPSPAAGGNGRTGRRRPAAPSEPLIARHAIVMLPSASTLDVIRRETAERAPAPKGVFVFADPIFSRNDDRVKALAAAGARGFARETPLAAGAGMPAIRAGDEAGEASAPRMERLPFTRTEALAILSHASTTDNRVVMDFDADREAALSSDLGQYRYLHFATHGILDNAQPQLSGLALSGINRAGGEQNGFLRMIEIYNLRLPAELVVLSGCRTGLGREIRGEGLVGLTRGFMYAGAKRVMASLWQVNDAATAELMNRFYRRLLGPAPQSPADALRGAQLSMLRQKQWQAPYYWAAFALQGEW